MAENNESKKVMYCDMDKFADSICKDMRLSEDEANKFIQLLWEQPSIDVAIPQNEMLPCPFCGGEPEMRHWRAIVNGRAIYPYQVMCKECKSRAGSSGLRGITLTRKEAIDLWNRRIPNV